MWFYVLYWCLGISTAFSYNSLDGSSPFKISISSRNNATGHSIAQVQLLHEGASEYLGSWDVDVEHRTSSNGDSEPVLIVATVTAPPRKPFGYELKPGLGYYKMHTKGEGWHAARDVCYEEGGHLLIINSEREVAVARNLLRKHPKLYDDWRNSWTYVGISDEIKEGDFRTIFGETLNSTGYTMWGPNEPGEGTSGNCGCVGRRGDLADTDCENHLAYICEQPLQ
ncbi:Hemolymph lipopolysaccharide-binding protein [Blattella germanica]|nr:Hemolymph lipopolysaccharide-binding protein [Blattella germanica]